jgi:hypothetical protein
MYSTNNNEVKMQSSCTHVSSTVLKEQQQEQQLSTDAATGPFAMFTLELLEQRRKMVEDAMTTLMKHHSRTVKTTQKAQLSKSFHKAISSPPSSSLPVVTDSNTAIGPILSSLTPNMIDPPILSTMMPAAQASTTSVSTVLSPPPPQIMAKPRDTAKNMLYQAYLQAVAAKGGRTTPAPTKQ